MAAYAVFIKEKTLNETEMATYASLAGGTLAGRPVKLLALYGKQEVWEGAAAEGVVILEFPDMAAARDWYESPAYREAREHRFKGADYRAILVEGA
ncbi:MAG: DUF1330 domain-containing protein [Kiritimatiellae bacterium]|nr:DUF1330 domain-containing protein [Kiritimatiellia bacterium]